MAKDTMAATIKEVAKLAGVSYQAVSAVLNGNLGKVSDKTRERIYAAAERVDYRPNQMARTLVSGKSDLIGFVTQDIRSPFYADLTYEVQRQAEERGIRVIIMDARWNDEQTLTDLALLTGYSVTGLFLVSDVLAEAEKRRILPAGTPVILIDSQSEHYNNVTFDYMPGMREAFQLLHSRGLRRIVFVHDPVNPWKLDAYRRTCAEFNCTPEEVRYSSPCTAGEAPLVELGRKLAAQPLPDAFLIASDYDSALIMQGFHYAGLRVPQDVSIVSIDDSLAGRITCPPLTTIRIDRARLIGHAFDMLDQLTEHPQSAPRQTVIPTELVVRDSVKEI